MHPRKAVSEALRLGDEGRTATEIARQMGIPRGTVRDWLYGRLPRSSRLQQAGADICEACGGEEHRFDHLSTAYVYLLGLYLGDGTISTHPRDVYRLRVFLDKRYPGIVAECKAAMRAVVPWNRVHAQLRPSNCFEVHAYSKTWPCLFPQHGPGKKHERPIVLTPWQWEFVSLVPELMLRGLIHSDGCRFINTGSGGWVCPRYTFTNYSADIRAIFCRVCDLLDLHWTSSGKYVLYVSRKADVARMDEFIGPKR